MTDWTTQSPNPCFNLNNSVILGKQAISGSDEDGGEEPADASLVIHVFLGNERKQGHE